MEDELRLSLLIAGTCFIVAVLAHGIWKIRKNNRTDTKPRREPRQWDNTPVDAEPNRDYAGDDSAHFDDLGIGKVRVVSSASSSGDPSPADGDAEPLPDAADTDSATAQASVDDNADDDSTDAKPAADGTDVEKSSPKSKTEGEPEKPKLYGSVVSNPKPHLQTHPRPADESTAGNQAAFPEPPGFLLKEEEDAGVHHSELSHPVEGAQPEQSSAASTSLGASNADEAADKHATTPAPQPTMPARESISASDLGEQNKKWAKAKRAKGSIQQRQEPNFGDEQMRIDFDEAMADEPRHSATETAGKQQSQSSLPEQEVLVLNVKAPEDKPIHGAVLLPMLLTLGFKFGDQDIFHRHVNSNGKGPVLFSLANMFKPGIFDIDKLETFATQGVSLFMILPIEADPHQVFNMMHNAARKLADEFDGQVLDGRRSVLTKQGLQQYVEKIREFERRRMIARH